MKKLLLTTLIMALPARAELPLSLEGLNPEQNKFKLSVGLSYYNQNRDSYSQGRSQYLLTPQNQSIEIPGRLQNGRNNSDIFSTNVGLNYGLNDDTELYGSVGGYWRSNRYSLDGQRSSSSKGEFSNVSLGVNQVLLRDGYKPLLVGTVETNLYEKVQGKGRSGRSWYFGANTYKAIDPVVFSFGGGYRANFGTTEGVKTGNYFQLNGGVSFAANDRVSLSSHLRWLGREPDKFRGEKLGNFETSTSADIGVGYSFSRDTSINADVRWNLSGRDDGANVNFTWQHRF